MKVSRLKVVHPVSPLPGLDVEFSGNNAHFSAEVREGYVHVTDSREGARCPRFAVPLANVAMLVLDEAAKKGGAK